MSLSNFQRQNIINSLVYEIGKSAYLPSFSVASFSKSYNLSIQSVYRYLTSLEKENKIIKLKVGKKNKYSLVDAFYQFKYSIANLSEDVVWSQAIKPLLQDIPEIAFKNCNYAFSEMLNNAIDHSEGTEVSICVYINAFRISFQIIDNGIGIFTKIASALCLEEKRFAVLELAKGKFTTAPESHTGEGIFFSAKASDVFSIFSDDLVFSALRFTSYEREWIHDFKRSRPNGTAVLIEIFLNHSMPLSELFEQYTQDPDKYGFTKTIVPVKLLEYGDQNPTFISRSQAKRLLVRFERFERIELDFSGVDEIGQGFADEVFRIFKIQHSNSQIISFNCNQRVQQMINRVMATEIV